jgi:hypothetical protein
VRHGFGTTVMKAVSSVDHDCAAPGPDRALGPARERTRWPPALGPAPSASATGAVAHSNFLYLGWTPIVAGAIVAAALSSVLLTFGSGIGLAVVSPSATWRDTSSLLALLGGLWLLLTSLASLVSEVIWPARCDRPSTQRRLRKWNFVMGSTVSWFGEAQS